MNQGDLDSTKNPFLHEPYTENLIVNNFYTSNPRIWTPWFVRCVFDFGRYALRQVVVLLHLYCIKLDFLLSIAKTIIICFFWHGRFTYELGCKCLYPNLPEEYALVVNHREKGENYVASGSGPDGNLLSFGTLRRLGLLDEAQEGGRAAVLAGSVLSPQPSDTDILRWALSNFPSVGSLARWQFDFNLRRVGALGADATYSLETKMTEMSQQGTNLPIFQHKHQHLLTAVQEIDNAIHFSEVFSHKLHSLRKPDSGIRERRGASSYPSWLGRQHWLLVLDMIEAHLLPGSHILSLVGSCTPSPAAPSSPSAPREGSTKPDGTGIHPNGTSARTDADADVEGDTDGDTDGDTGPGAALVPLLIMAQRGWQWHNNYALTAVMPSLLPALPALADDASARTVRRAWREAAAELQVLHAFVEGAVYKEEETTTTTGTSTATGTKSSGGGGGGSSSSSGSSTSATELSSPACQAGIAASLGPLLSVDQAAAYLQQCPLSLVIVDLAYAQAHIGTGEEAAGGSSAMPASSSSSSLSSSSSSSLLGDLLTRSLLLLLQEQKQKKKDEDKVGDGNTLTVFPEYLLTLGACSGAPSDVWVGAGAGAGAGTGAGAASGYSGPNVPQRGSAVSQHYMMVEDMCFISGVEDKGAVLYRYHKFVCAAFDQLVYIFSLYGPLLTLFLKYSCL
jgi:uncharacterized membrane protein YgcG